MSTAESATLLWLCLSQGLIIYYAAGFVAGLILHERADGYEGRHRVDPGSLSTWQSHGTAFRGHLTAAEPDDLDERRAAVDATAVAIEERVEIWNRDLLAGPLFDLPPAGPDAPQRYEPAAGDLAYLALSPGALDRTATQPARPHPARVDTSELTVIDLGEVERDDTLAGVT